MRQALKNVREFFLEESLKRFFQGTYALNEHLASHTSMRIGGPARVMLMPRDVHDLARLVRFLRAVGMRFAVLGAGTNVLIGDNSLPLAIIKLNAPFFRKLKITGQTVFAAAGVALAAVRDEAAAQGLTGGEFLTGIPGTVGGALVMNAGVRGLEQEPAGTWHSMADCVTKVGVMDEQGNIALYSRAQIEFGYRSSSLKKGIVLGAWMEFAPAEPAAIAERTREFFERKQRTQEFSRPNAGCVFKNPIDATLSAGRLIDLCQLKGRAIGDAQISTVHGNFIVNNGAACFQEVKSLMELIQQEVFRKFAVWLEPEVEIWDTGGRQ